PEDGAQSEAVRAEQRGDPLQVRPAHGGVRRALRQLVVAREPAEHDVTVENADTLARCAGCASSAGPRADGCRRMRRRRARSGPPSPRAGSDWSTAAAVSG